VKKEVVHEGHEGTRRGRKGEGNPASLTVLLVFPSLRYEISYLFHAWSWFSPFVFLRALRGQLLFQCAIGTSIKRGLSAASDSRTASLRWSGSIMRWAATPNAYARPT